MSLDWSDKASEGSQRGRHFGVIRRSSFHVVKFSKDRCNGSNKPKLSIRNRSFQSVPTSSPCNIAWLPRLFPSWLLQLLDSFVTRTWTCVCLKDRCYRSSWRTVSSSLCLSVFAALYELNLRLRQENVNTVSVSVSVNQVCGHSDSFSLIFSQILPDLKFILQYITGLSVSLVCAETMNGCI